MRERQVLDALQQEANVWINRVELAKRLGRKRLNQGDFEALAALQARGVVEVEKRPDPRPIGYITYYRVKE